MKQKHRHYGYIIFMVLFVLAIAASSFFPQLNSLSSPSVARDYILGFGVSGGLVFIFLLLLSVPLPIPSVPLVLAGGYIYGTIIGSTLSLIAVLIGASISFSLVRAYGRPALENMVDTHHLTHFNHTFKKRGIFAAFVSYTLPIFPSDCVSAALGLTRIKYWTFFLVVALGHIPRFLIINSIGEDLLTGFTLKTAVIIAVAAVLLIIAVFRENLKKFFFEELKMLKKRKVTASGRKINSTKNI